MITPEVMNDLLENKAFRAFLAARTTGVPGDAPSKKTAAEHVTSQIAIVAGCTKGSARYNLACAVLLQFIDIYLNSYGEQEPPYLPEGHEQFNPS
jgi:hypothetical protein